MPKKFIMVDIFQECLLCRKYRENDSDFCGGHDRMVR